MYPKTPRTGLPHPAARQARQPESPRHTHTRHPGRPGPGRLFAALFGAALYCLTWSQAGLTQSDNEATTPQRLLWGDTHLHTVNSMDAVGFGVRLGPAEAFRFARGEEVQSTHGLPAKLSRPLDFLAVTDHSDLMGVIKLIIAGEESLMQDPGIRQWHTRLRGDTAAILKATMDFIHAFADGTLPAAIYDRDLMRQTWLDYVSTADEHNTPGVFTAMIGYEWTSTENGNNLHRNVLYRDDAASAGRMLPYTSGESFNPEDLWSWMADYEALTGGKVLAIPHNGNMSNGLMFPVETNPATGEPLGKAYASLRARWEPLVEVTQIKGDGETHPLLSPGDEFADYGTWDAGNLTDTVPKTNDMLEFEYARSALRNGLKLKRELGVNPYQFGMIGATDSHTGLATAGEDNFFGKHSGSEPAAGRAEGGLFSEREGAIQSWKMLASGLAGVWATDNTREAIFDAMMRKEVYASTGPRISVRFFGGWEFDSSDLGAKLAASGYRKGVPMGSVLPPGPAGRAPSFIAAAMKDPISGNLDRLQVVKAWLDGEGETQETVYDIAWSDSDSRQPGSERRLPDVGNTVNVSAATWENSIGDAELTTVWTDPDFDPRQPALYYLRVIEIPTPRWTTYDAQRYGTRIPPGAPATTQERAYTSPIWYTPGASPAP